MFGFSSMIMCILTGSHALGAALPGPVPAEVVRVIDADTIAVKARVWPGHSVETRVRLAGIDAPETRRPDCEAERALGERATALVAELLPPGSQVSLYEIELGSFAGRVLARIELADARDLGALLGEAGLAQPYGRSNWCPAAPPGARD